RNARKHIIIPMTPAMDGGRPDRRRLATRSGWRSLRDGRERWRSSGRWTEQKRMRLNSKGPVPENLILQMRLDWRKMLFPVGKITGKIWLQGQVSGMRQRRSLRKARISLSLSGNRQEARPYWQGIRFLKTGEGTP